ncbi:MAG TPA: prolyl oligopeptidase family serine peptidase, partial [Gemmataceae bacterium]|nr:prolyl oligopeptidase family serine peptidase [Gemmataceae bacterium]
MRTRTLLLVGLIGWLPLVVSAQQPAKQAKAKNKANEIRPPDDAARRIIDDKAARLKAALDQLRGKRIADDVLAEVEIYAKAVEWVSRHNEWFGDTAKWTAAVLDDGLKRAEQLGTANEAAWRKTTGKSVVRAYRSKIDGSVQPYAITAPADYGKDPSKLWRLDVVLHGRDATLTEVKFLNAFRGKAAPADQDFIQLDIYGRGNNAYRWAGEEDVFEAMNAYMTTEREARGRYTYDGHRLVLRGFSMGGAGAWHLGLHHPDWWSVIGPGAGFTTTRGYVRDLPNPLPSYVEKCLHIYDAVDYAENAAMVPVVAYAGANDPQLQAAKNIEARLKPLDIPMTLLIAPDTEHRLTPEYAKKAEAEYAKYAGPGKGRPFYPER